MSPNFLSQASRGVDLERALLALSAKENELDDRRREMEVRENMIKGFKASDAQKSVVIDRLRHDLHESNKRVRHLSVEVSRGLQERDRAIVQAKADRQAAQHSKGELEVEQLARTKFQEEYARLEMSLVEAQSHIAYLESEAHRSEVIEEYRQSLFGKVEVTITCKAGYDYLKEQLPTVMRNAPDHFYYPSRVANCLEALLDIERLGWGLDLGGSGAGDEESDDGSDDEADEGPDERTEEGGKGPAKEAGRGLVKNSWASSSGKKSEGAEPKVQSTPSPPTASALLPLTPGASMDMP